MVERSRPPLQMFIQSVHYRTTSFTALQPVLLTIAIGTTINIWHAQSKPYYPIRVIRVIDRLGGTEFTDQRLVWCHLVYLPNLWKISSFGLQGPRWYIVLLAEPGNLPLRPCSMGYGRVRKCRLTPRSPSLFKSLSEMHRKARGVVMLCN